LRKCDEFYNISNADVGTEIIFINVTFEQTKK